MKNINKLFRFIYTQVEFRDLIKYLKYLINYQTIVMWPFLGVYNSFIEILDIFLIDSFCLILWNIGFWRFFKRYWYF